jgi:hypothetical protein
MPISEMQARLYCAQMAGEITLPDKADQLADALDRMHKIGKNFVNRPRHTIQASENEYGKLAKIMTKRHNQNIFQIVLNSKR